jgi:hypothetical protein
MRFSRITFFVVFLLICTVSTKAQVKKSARSTGYKILNVSRAKAQVMCPIFNASEYPYQGFGLKMGDPFALTYKYYPNKNWSIAVDGGKAASGLYNRYYRNLFTEYVPDSLSGNESVRYVAHKAVTDLFLEAKILYQWNAEKISKGLQFYIGAGWQWRNTKLRYDYLYTNGPFENKLGKFAETRVTYGVTLLTGLEYSYFSIPISAFIEVEWYTDAILDPGYQRFQGGLGLRYIF